MGSTSFAALASAEEIKDTHRLWRADLIEQHNDDRCSPFRAEFIRPRFLWVS